ncbi:MAG: CocE/NonD family hydrolase, partial [Limnobacter sp.]|nr:CocE/NonD family hydrolase [Limnobacter sp.]
MTLFFTPKRGLAKAFTFSTLALALAACGSESDFGASGNTAPADTQANQSNGKRPITVKDQQLAVGHAAKTENVTIMTDQGIAVAMTVFYPTLEEGEAAPLLMHSHGFGGNRVSSLDFEEAEQTSEIGIDTLQVAYNEKNPVQERTGWYVISYDQAGHGDSGAEVNIMDPEVEGEMYKAVIDWAENNLSNLAFERQANDFDPVVGAIGRSYGGAFQLMGAGIDNRLDAMVPNGTWHDLRYSLNPMGVPKTTYLNGLVLTGLQSIQGRFSPELYDALVRASTTNEVPAEVVQRLGSNGAVEYCTDEDFGAFNRDTELRPIPSLFIQGLRDILFNINESIASFECYNAVNPAAKLISVKYGHSLDGLGMQESPSDSLANTEAKYAFNESKIWLASNEQSCPAS